MIWVLNYSNALSFLLSTRSLLVITRQKLVLNPSHGLISVLLPSINEIVMTVDLPQ